MSHWLHADIAKHELLQLAQDFSPGCHFRERLQTYRRFCLALEVRAFCALLARADVTSFSRGLMIAAVNWRALLEYTRRSEPSAQVPASLNRPLLGAICCGPISFACELAALSSRELVRPEYDDEFLSALFLQEYLQSRSGSESRPVDLEAICDQIDAYLGKETPQVEVFRSLARKEENRFQKSFLAWNESAAQELAARAEAPGAPTWLSVVRYIWLEGMAVLKLAEAAGLQSPGRIYRLIPPLLKLAPTVNPSAISVLLGRSVQEQDL